MNETKFVELTFFLGHNNGGFVNKKVWNAFLLIFSQLVVEKSLNSVICVNLEQAGRKNIKSLRFKKNEK